MADEDTKTPDDNNDAQPTPEQLQEDLKRINAKFELEKKHRKTAETKVSEYEKWKQEQEEAQAAREEEAARKKAEGGDTKALEESWKGKLTKTEEKHKAEMERLNGMISSLTVKSDAQKVASQLFGDKADIMLHHIEKRLKVEFGDEGPKTRVLDESGQPSASNLDDLINEFKVSPKFASLVVATKATGSGANGGKNGGSAPDKTIKRSEWDNKSHVERMSLSKQGITVIDA